MVGGRKRQIVQSNQGPAIKRLTRRVIHVRPTEEAEDRSLGIEEEEETEVLDESSIALFLDLEEAGKVKVTRKKYESEVRKCYP